MGSTSGRLSLSCLRRNIGVVQQDVYLFAASVAENIRYGDGAASQHEVESAAKKANAHDFIMALPQGYQTSYRPARYQIIRRAAATLEHRARFPQGSAADHPGRSHQRARTTQASAPFANRWNV